MSRKGQVFIVGIWVLAILSVLALGISARARMAWQLSQYYQDRLKSRCLALAALKRAQVELQRDTDKIVDTILDSWANNENIFSRIVLTEKGDDFASVSYTYGDAGQEQIQYGARDEESKVNLNKASEAFLSVLFEEAAIAQPQEVARHVLIWRGSVNDDARVYAAAGYAPKGDKFVNIDELVLVQGLEFVDVGNLKGFFTVYGDGKVNINTVSDSLLVLLCKGTARELNAQGALDVFASNLANKILESRRGRGYFSNETDLRDNIVVTGDEEANLLTALCSKISFCSDDFLIEVSGNVGKIKSEIQVVYSRSKDQILFWHET